MFFRTRRAERKQKEHDQDLDLLASLIENNFVKQLLGISLNNLALTIVRSQKTVEAFTDEIRWNELDDFQRKQYRDFVAQFSDERLTDTNLLTLFATVPKIEVRDQDLLVSRVAKKLADVKLQSLYAVERGGTLWFVAMFAR